MLTIEDNTTLHTNGCTMLNNEAKVAIFEDRTLEVSTIVPNIVVKM